MREMALIAFIKNRSRHGCKAESSNSPVRLRTYINRLCINCPPKDESKRTEMTAKATEGESKGSKITPDGVVNIALGQQAQLDRIADP